MCVCQLVHFFTIKWKSGIFCSVSKIFLQNLVDIFPWNYLTDWLKIKIFGLCVCQLINLFNENGKNGYFAQFSRYIYQLWLTSSSGAIHILAKIKFHKFVCQLLHLLTLWIILKITVSCWWNSVKLSMPISVTILVLMIILWWRWWYWQ